MRSARDWLWFCGLRPQLYRCELQSCSISWRFWIISKMLLRFRQALKICELWGPPRSRQAAECGTAAGALRIASAALLIDEPVPRWVDDRFWTLADLTGAAPNVRF